MSVYIKVLRLLRHEHDFQEKLLEMLSKERAAIVKLRQDELEKLNDHKRKLILQAQKLEQERTSFMREVIGGENSSELIKFSDFTASCEDLEVRVELEHAGDDLKQIAQTVRIMNTHNATLIKQSLGIVASTLAIIRSSPETELPIYGASGELSSEHEDPAFGKVSKSLSREA